MYKQTRQHKSAFRFRRFCRAGWAAYSSMHREVTIGQVAVHIADRGLRKSAAVVALSLVLGQGALMAQTDDDRETRTLPEVQVTIAADTLFGSPEPAAVLSASEIRNSSVRTVSDLVALLPAVDMRQRGVGDAQADLSMRGGTFDQMILMINGINVTDAQTGHHNMDLPIDVSMVERVELLSPSQLMSRGVVAYCGAVNIVVNEEYRDRLMAEISGGSYGTANASLLGTCRLGKWTMTAAASYHRSDGYMQNTDYRHGSLFLQAVRHADNNDWHLQLGGQIKDFGSQAFYSTSYPDQFEATRTLVGSVSNVHRWGGMRSETAIYGRLHRDRFELFRDGYAAAPAWYSGHNHHLGSTAGLRSRVVAKVGTGEVLGGVDVRREGIWSNVLGNVDSSLSSPFTKSAARTGVSLFGGYRYARGSWAAQAVALGLYNTQFGPNYGFAADVQYKLTKINYHFSLSRTYRLPSFTDLYYKSVNQIANPDLNAESNMNAEIGVSVNLSPLSLIFSTYYRSGNGTIDWVRRPGEEVWYSMNHTDLDAVGVDASAVVRMDMATLRAAYSWCHIMQDAGGWISGSALDYLRHKGSLSICVEPVKGLRIKADATYRFREGFYTDADGNILSYGGVLLFGAGAEYQWHKMTLFADGFNLSGRHYRDHGGVPMPGTTFIAGVRLDL